MTAPRLVLLVEDDPSLNTMLSDFLVSRDFEVASTATIQEARAAFETRRPDLVLMDVRLPDGSGLELLPELTARAPVIIMTAYGVIDQAMRAVRAGASDYLLKPVSPEALELAVQRVFDTAELKRDVAFWEAQAAQRNQNSALVGDSPEMVELRRQIALYAASDAAVLIEGETGTGKELVARVMHEISAHAEGHFVPIVCSTGDETALSSELFGHEPGAFPGAETGREGMLEHANDGVLYISDIAELSPAMQSRLLRVIETGSFRRMGGTNDISTRARIFAGTSYTLPELVARDTFRSELYFHLSSYRLHVPSLRDRPSDIIPLATYFVQGRTFLRGVTKSLDPQALEDLSHYDWPGNVRELRNVIERGVILSGAEPEIRLPHLAIGGGPDGGHVSEESTDGVVLNFGSEPSLDELCAAYLRILIERHEGNRRKIAEIMGMSERNIYRQIRKYGL